MASSAELLARDEGDVWDSGEPDPSLIKAVDDRSIHVPHEGAELTSNTEYFWKVRTWNGVDNVSPWSEPCRFRTGDLGRENPTDCAPLTTTEVAPRTVARTGPETWFVDFGRAAFGTVKLTVVSPDKRSLQVSLGEVREGPYGINRYPGGSRRYRETRCEVAPGPQTVQIEIPKDLKNTGSFAIRMPDSMFEVMPFRYCEISGYPGTLKRDDIRQVAVHYPFDDDAATFTSSSKVLNDVWDLCRYTMKATSFTGYYVDGDRERIPYEADAFINQLGHYACDREYAMARRTHEYLITTPTWPTEWILDSVLIGWYDYLYSGSAASIARHYQDLKAKTLAAIAREDGLISTDLMTDEVLEAIHFSGRSAANYKRGVTDNPDWPHGERDNFDMRPVNAEVNAFHYMAVTRMAKIAEVLGEVDDARWYRERAKLIRKSFINKLIDPITGLVLDGEGSTHSSLHANMTAFAFGLVPKANRERVIDHMKSKGMACSVYGSQFLLEALYEAGEDEYALSLLTSTSERSWAHMIYDVGTTISLEAWDDRLKPNQDWNHAWGAVPANIIPRYLMGVRPASPGFERITIQPQPGTLEWAELKTPTIRGPVTVRFNNVPHTSFHLETETPANTTADVSLPRLGSVDPSVVVDGRRVVGRIDGESVTINGVGSGLHRFTRAV